MNGNFLFWLNVPNFCTDVDSTSSDAKAFVRVPGLCATTFKFYFSRDFYITEIPDLSDSHAQYINHWLFPDSEHRLLHLLLARERLARFEAKWSPVAGETGHCEGVRAQGGPGLTSATIDGAKTEPKDHRETGHSESVRTQDGPGLTSAATDGAKTEPKVHREEPALQACPVDPCVPGELLGVCD